MVRGISIYALVLSLTIILGAVFQTVAMWKTGGAYEYGVGYWGPLARDGVWHEALVGQLKGNFIPQNPGFAGERLANYHYFYDLLVAKISVVFGISHRFLIYQFFPIVFSILLGVGTYFLSKKLFQDRLTSLFAVFFAYFASSFGWIVELTKRGSVWGGESAFWANQPVSMNLNPPFAISLVLMIFILILIESFLARSRKLKALILILLVGTLIGFKAYAGVVVIFGLVLLSIKKFIFVNNLKILLILIPSILISALIYLSQGKGAENLLVVQPLWLVDTMIDAGDRVGIPNFTQRRFNYIAEGKWFNLALLQIIGLIIFFLGNLGTRMFAILGLDQKQLRNDLHFVVLTMAVVTFVLPLIFIQKGNPWNTIQFLYYGLFFAGLYTANGITRIFRSLQAVSRGRLFRKVAQFSLASIIILVTPISSIATFRSWLYPDPVAYISTNELEALDFLSKQSEGVVLKHSYDQFIRQNYTDPYPLFSYADNAYVSAYSGEAVYIEDVEQQIILDVDYTDRLNKVGKFFKEKDLVWSNQFLTEQDITYIYLPKVYFLPTAEQEYQMGKIFENKEVNIYKVLQ